MIQLSSFSDFELSIIDKSWKFYHKNDKQDKNICKEIRICIYLRKSTEDIKDNSLKLQLNEINKFIKSINHNYHNRFHFYYDEQDIYAEDNVSGMQGRLRPEFDRMLNNIENSPGFYGVCIVYKLDRFSRKLEDTLKYITLLKGFKCVLKALDFEDNGDPTSDLLRNILGVVAQYHAQNSALTSIKGTLKKVEENKTVGLLPLGLISEKVKLGEYNKKGSSNIVIDDEKAIIIKIIFEKYARGESITSIKKFLEKNGFTKHDGSYLSWQQIYYILRNKRYNGTYIYAEPNRKKYRKYDNGVMKPEYYEKKDAFPKIIEDALFNKVQNIINIKHNTHQLEENNVTYLLSGLIYCGVCGKSMNGWSRSKYKGKKYYDYLCITHKKQKLLCPTKSINKLYVEEFILSIINYVINYLIKKYKTEIFKICNKQVTEFNDKLKYIKKEVNRKEQLIKKLIDRMIIDDSRMRFYEEKIELLEKDIILLREKENEISLKMQFNECVTLDLINRVDFINNLNITKLLIHNIIEKISVNNELIKIKFKTKN